MMAYLVRRLLYAVPILIGVNLLTFILFFFVSSPDSMARIILGDKRVSPEMIENWKRDRGYDMPRLFNAEADGAAKFTDTIFYRKNLPLFAFDFGLSDTDGTSIASEIGRRMGPSLRITLPMFFLSLFVTIVVAMFVAFYRGTYLDVGVLFLCVITMSISLLFYIIGGQFFFARHLRLFPISGFDEGLAGAKFLLLPILLGFVAGLGSGIRFNRTVFLEEINKDYIRTARAKGLGEGKVLFRHALKNAMIPILTSISLTIPFLITGNLLLENFFGIPGLGNYLFDAINKQDFAVVRAMVYLGAVLYIGVMILVDLSYTLVDPRVRLE